MAFQSHVAERRKARLRLGIAGASGSGKTASALLVAYGITGRWEDIGMLDTEHGSGELYVGETIGGTKIGQYHCGQITAPYTPAKYIEAIRHYEASGLKVIILDSLSHAWAGEGGLLDQQGREADRSGNSWTAWRKVTPQHNQLVDGMLQSKCHIIATMRSKAEYVQAANEKGKQEVKKIGMAPIQRDGMDYEFTVMLDMDASHYAQASKDRTNLLDGQIFKPSVKFGQDLLAWLETGADEMPQPEKAEPESTKPEATKPPAPEPPPPPQGPPPDPTDRPITKAELDGLVTIAASKGWTPELVKGELKRRGFASSTAIRLSLYPKLVKFFGEHQPVDPKPITPAQVTRLWTIAGQHHYDHDTVHALIGTPEMGGFTSANDITEDRYDGIIGILSEPNAQAS